MKNLFAKHEIQFIAWFSVIFVVSVVFLALVGLLPSEFMPEGGRTFEQITRDAVREIVEGKPLDPSRDPNRPITVATNGDIDYSSYNSGQNNGQNSGQTSSGSNNILNPTGSNGGQQGGGSSLNNSNMGNGANGPINTGTSQPNTSSQVQTSSGSTMYAEEPTRLVISSIGVDTSVANPKSTSYETLDAALTKSVVRYPGSGLPGLGNMFIFGHSTGFSVVQNQAYKVFNKLKNVKQGATVTVYSKSAVYEYKVTSVKLVDKSKALVEFDTKTNMLTLSTCDSFGRDEDRYVVEANLVSIRKI